jgi:AcrR family transcriptional regulator
MLPLHTSRCFDSVRIDAVGATAPLRTERPKPRAPGAAGAGSLITVPLVSARDYVPAWQQRVVHRSLGAAASRSLQTAGRLVDAAFELLEKGEDDFTIQQVADLAGLSVRSFYQHFLNKDDFVVAVFEVSTELDERRLQEAVEGHADPFDRLLTGLWSLCQLSREGEREVARGLSRIRLRLLHSSPEPVFATNRRIIGFLQSLLEEAAAAAGAVNQCDPGQVAFAMFSLAQSVTMESMLGGQRDPLPTEFFIDFFLHGLGREVPGDWRSRLRSL